MAISRNMMERQLRAGGGIMTLDEPRQGYFLGKIVRKAKKAVKKVFKSPLGKAAILGGLGFGLGGAKFLGGKGIFAGGQGLSRFSNLLNLVRPAATNVSGKRGLLSGLFYDKDGVFSPGRAALTGLTGAAVAAPFLMGGGDEEEDPGVPVSGIQPMVSDIRNQARNFYRDPAAAAASGLFFMPQRRFVQDSFLAAGGGLADIPRGGYKEGESVISKQQAAMIEDMQDKGMDMSTIESLTGLTKEQITNYLSSLNQKAEGGIMDLGGMEKDYREGGFVPIGAEERADDVPARLSKNEFVFTADAVRNAGQGDIDKGAEVMQNMMDNLEAGGTISEESQGKENPAQEMFNQAQMLESRIV